MPPGRPGERAPGSRGSPAGSWVLWWALAAAAAGSPPFPPQPTRKAYSFGRSFLGLDKCNACVGTSICKKFFKEEIRFERWLSSQLMLPPAHKSWYLANYTDDSETWRPVVLSRLASQALHTLSDRSICSSAGRPRSCSIEAVLRATPRFQDWARSHLLLPRMVQGLAAPMVRCPSQRLLDRLVRRYAEVTDAGSVQMKHFAERDKLRLLYTLSVNQHPLLLQMFPGTEGWPFPRYYGSCGRVMVWASTRPIRSLYGSPLETRADLAYQLLHVTQGLGSNSLRFRLYYTRVTEDMFATFEDGKLFIVDASTIGIIDQLEGFKPERGQEQSRKDIFSCLSGSCDAPPPCGSVRPSQSFALLCRDLLPKLLTARDARVSRLPRDVARLLGVCADGAQTDGSVLGAARALMELLRPLRPCSAHLAYRYPECRYSQEF
ncbi:divergent protein kinase domain 2B [Megalops cyprinoides]|uniref:divergent protein kinase domain 2B n=1 Tax=Megalops cyprinoides TaxID=118141 RepID=UPI0018644B16|nr:divergent protein kinase domain 2B [Megalops cyprinoides]